MSPLRKRLHKWVHRVAGSSVALVGALQGLQAVNVEPVLGPRGAGVVLISMGVFIAALEALPVVVGWFEEEVVDDTPAGLDS